MSDYWVLFYEEKMFKMLDYVIFGFIFPLAFLDWQHWFYFLFLDWKEKHMVYIYTSFWFCCCVFLFRTKE